MTYSPFVPPPPRAPKQNPLDGSGYPTTAQVKDVFHTGIGLISDVMPGGVDGMFDEPVDGGVTGISPRLRFGRSDYTHATHSTDGTTAGYDTTSGYRDDVERIAKDRPPNARRGLGRLLPLGGLPTSVRKWLTLPGHNWLGSPRQPAETMGALRRTATRVGVLGAIGVTGAYVAGKVYDRLPDRVQDSIQHGIEVGRQWLAEHPAATWGAAGAVALVGARRLMPDALQDRLFGAPGSPWMPNSIDRWFRAARNEATSRHNTVSLRLAAGIGTAVIGLSGAIVGVPRRLLRRGS